MREFFGFGGYQRSVEGFLSWQHLAASAVYLGVMALLAVIIGRARRNADIERKNRVLAAAAILIDGLELFKIVLICFRSHNAMQWLYILPLFLCSIQLITIPLAAFAKGRLKNAALDFVVVFGLLGAVMGIIGAGNNYSCYPVVSFDNVVSGLTHAISGFCSLYILISGMASMKRSDMHITFFIMLGFCIAAYAVNKLIDYNYMFLMRGDGTPYDMIFNLVGGSPVLYPLAVVGLFLIYIAAFYSVYYIAAKKKS